MVGLVYIGATRRSGDVVHAYAPLGPNGELSERAWTYPDALTEHPPGSHIEFEHQAGDRRLVLRDTARYVRAWPDEPAVLAWSAAHEAVIGSEQAFAQDPPPRLSELLDPLRAAYDQLNEGDRATLIAQVVRSIVGR